MTFDKQFYGIAMAGREWLAHRLNALLNSRLVWYLLFMNSASAGWDRTLYETQDWLQLPVPRSLLDMDAAKTWDAAVALEQNLVRLWGMQPAMASARGRRMGPPPAEMDAHQEALDRIVYDLYSLSPNEVQVVEDTLHMHVEPFLRRNEPGYQWLPAAHPDMGDLLRYARRLCDVLNSLLTYGDLALHPMVFSVTGDDLCACHFYPMAVDAPAAPQAQALADRAVLLARIDPRVRSQAAAGLAARRDLRVYEPDGGIWLIKPAQRRLWTEAAAINDADTVVREHMDAASEV